MSSAVETPVGMNLDAEVAERVMGYQRLSVWQGDPLDCLTTPDGNRLVGWYRKDGTFTWHAWERGGGFSTDIVAALAVLESSYRYSIERFPGSRRYGCSIALKEGHASGFAVRDTLPEAICRAALVAAGRKEGTQ